MIKNKFDSKIAKKIISDYAEKITYYKTENQMLKKQVTDLKVSLMLNKDLLDKHMKSNQKESNDVIISLLNEKEEMKKAIKNLQIEYSNKFISTKSDIERIKAEKFQLENQLIEKQNTISLLEGNNSSSSASTNANTKSNSKGKVDNCPLYTILSPTKAIVEINNQLISSQERIISLESMLNEAKAMTINPKQHNHNYNDSDYNLTNESQSSVNDPHHKSNKILQFLPIDYYQISAHTADLNTEFDNLESSLYNSAKNNSMSLPIPIQMQSLPIPSEYSKQFNNDQLDFQLKTAKEIIALSEEKIHKYKKNINTLKSKNKMLNERVSQLEKEIEKLNKNYLHMHNRHSDMSIGNSMEKYQDNSMRINQNISSLIRYFTDEYNDNDNDNNITIETHNNNDANKTIISSVS